MGLAQRVGFYRELERLRKRPLIAYVTSPRTNATGQIGADAIPEILDQLEALPAETTAVDLLTVSNGGDPTVAWRIVSLLRERVKDVAVLIPQAAFSAATLLALGADEIVMHPNGNLGPVDPQIQVQRRKPGSQDVERFDFGSEDLAGFLDFARNHVGLTDQKHLGALFDRFCTEVGVVPVGVATRGSRLALSLGEKLLKMHMNDAADAQQARIIAESLNKGFFHHGYPLSRAEAREIGLKIAKENPKVEALMWSIWTDLETELEARRPFEPTAILATDTRAAALFGPAPQFNMPAVNPQLMQMVAQQLLASVNTVTVDPVEFELRMAAIESPRLAKSAIFRGKILASRTPDLQIIANVVRIGSGWENVPLPKEGTS